MQQDGKLAISALKEARQTIETMSRLVGSLANTQTEDSERPDIDAMIARKLGVIGADQQAADANGPQTSTDVNDRMNESQHELPQYGHAPRALPSP